MANYAPEPWRVLNIYDPWGPTNRFSFTVEVKDRSIKTTDKHNIQMATNRLIQAAPKMHALLQECMRWPGAVPTKAVRKILEEIEGETYE